jgi:hypothetical protein
MPRRRRGRRRRRRRPFALGGRIKREERLRVEG